MRFRPELFKWYLILAGKSTVVVWPVALLYALFKMTPHSAYDPWVWLFIAVHSGLTALHAGGQAPGDRAYLETRGYSRDAVWAHAMLASAFCLLIVWITIALCAWTPARRELHDLIGGRYFLLYPDIETGAPWGWLVLYASSFPMFFYLWIRRAQPTARSDAGDYLCVAFIGAGLCAFGVTQYRSLAFQLATAAVGLFLGVLLLWAGRALHRSMEVNA